MPDGAFEAFERMRTEQLRRKRRQTVAYGALFLACLAVAVTIGEFDLPLLIRNLPRITEYIGRLLPVLRPESLMADLGTWYYGIGYWSLLLLETILMAFLATLLGTVGATLLCFPASRNLTGSNVPVFAARRVRSEAH